MFVPPPASRVQVRFVDFSIRRFFYFSMFPRFACSNFQLIDISSFRLSYTVCEYIQVPPGPWSIWSLVHLVPGPPGPWSTRPYVLDTAAATATATTTATATATATAAATAAAAAAVATATYILVPGPWSTWSLGRLLPGPSMMADGS